MFHKTNNKNKKRFCKSCCSVLVVKMYWESIKKFVWSLMVQKGTIAFKNYFKQISIPFKIFADFECNIKSVESYEGSYSKKYQDHIPCSFGYKLFCVDDKFTKPIVVFKSENTAYEFVKAILKEYQYCKKK